MELHPPLHLGIVAIEKGAFESSLTKVANFIVIPRKAKELLKTYERHVAYTLNQDFYKFEHAGIFVFLIRFCLLYRQFVINIFRVLFCQSNKVL